VKRSAVSSRMYDHTSVLRMIESRFNLEPLTVRDASANDLSAELDLTLPVTPAPQFEVPQGNYTIPCETPGGDGLLRYV